MEMTGYLIEDKISNGIAPKDGGIIEVFRLIGATLQRFPRSALTYDMSKTILTKKGISYWSQQGTIGTK